MKTNIFVHNIKIFVWLILMLLTVRLKAQITAGPNYPGNANNFTGVGTVAWQNSSNSLTDDNTYATVSLSGATSNYLRATNFGFNIPDQAIITGITVTIGRFENATGIGIDVRDNEVKLLSAGNTVGNNYAVTTSDWPTTETSINYGGPNDLWGVIWTPAQINSSDFGVSLVVNCSNNRIARVDYFNISISYITSPFTFNSSGNITIPGTINCIQVEAWGGGGRGGSRISGSNQGYGGGGGGGYSRSIINITPGLYAVNVGLGSSTTAAGGDSWFNNNTTILARGGNSVPDNSTSGASGGAPGIGNFVFSGGNGANGYFSSGTDYGGGGGSSAGFSSNGTSAVNQNGGSAPSGGGNGGNGFSSTTTNGNGTNGSAPGGGGGGALRYSSGSANGGNGANGKVVISWVILQQPSAINGAVSPCTGSTQVYTVSSVSGITYSWTFPSGWIINSGQGTNSVTVTVGSNAGNVVVTPSVYCNGPTQTLNVTPVNGVPVTPGSISGNALACQKTTQNYSVPMVPGVTYTWTGPTGSVITSGQGTNSVNIYFGTSSGDVTVTPSNICGSGSAQTLFVTLQPSAPTQPSVISGISAPCQGTTQTYSVVNSPDVLYYSWSIPSDWTIISGQGSSSITVQVGTNNGIVEVAPQNTCGSGNPRKLNVTAIAAIPVQPVFVISPEAVCSGSNQYYSVVSSPFITYTWSFPAGWIIISGQGSDLINVIAGSGSGLITVTPANNCGTGLSASLSVNVDQSAPLQPVSITGETNPCQASVQSYSVPNLGSIYTWSVPADWSILSGQGTSNIMVTVGTSDGTVEVLASNACGQSIAQMLNVSVSPLPDQPSAISGNSVFCQGVSAVFSVTQVSGIVYNWIVPSGWNILSGQGTNSVLVSIGANSGSVQVTPSNGCGNGNLQQKFITVNLLPPADAGMDQGICVGASVIIGSAPISGNTYSWTSSPAGFSSTIANPLVTPDTTTIYYLTETVTSTGCSKTDAVTVFANQVISVAANPPVITMCSGSQANISLSSNITGTIFTWTANLTSGSSTIGFSDGTGPNIQHIISNTSGSTSVVTYNITAQANVCVNTLTSVEVNILPAPQVNSQSAIICSNEATSITLGSSSNGVTASSYNITSINSNGLVAATGNPVIGNGFNNMVIYDDAWINTSINPVNVLYTILPVSSSGCTGAPFNVTVTVKPKPIITNTPSKSICSGTSTNINLTATIPCSYSWTLGTITGGITGASPGTGNSINQILNNPSSSSSGTIQYLITAVSSSGNCVGNVFYLTVTVNPLPGITTPTSKNICSLSGTNINLSATTASTFSWTIGTIAGGITGATAGSGALINQTLTNPSTTAAGTVNYLVTPTSTTGSCAGNQTTITVTVNPLPLVSVGSSVNAVCPGVAFNLTSSSSNTTSPLIQWNSNPVGFSSNIANPTNVIQTVTTTYNVTYTNTTTGCSKTASKTVTANPLPVPVISADYCAVPGFIRLTASGGGTYLWNTNATSTSINVDVAGVYSVTVTNSFGCTAADYIDANNELVVDGSFTNFNPASPSFYSGYNQHQSYYNPSAPNPALTGLWPEGDYAVNTSAWYNPATNTGYHPNFHGQDHTNNPSGPRNFLMINGSTTDNPLKTIWQQTVTVVPNTDYYFSAWAMNLNPTSPAVLQFEVNGTLVGTIANLNSAPKPTTENQVGLTNWVRFYSNPKWNSGSATTAVIRIVNLNTVAGGNDFGLDDISFGTLAPIPFTINPGTGGEICSGQNLNLYANITGGRAPIQYTWTGPNGFNSNLQNPVIPNATTANAGTYTLSVVDGYGCNPVVKTTTATINPLPTASISGTAQVCQYGTQPNITFTGTTGTAPFTFTYKINGGSNQFISTSSGNSVTLNVSTALAGVFTYSLVNVQDAKGCSQNQSGTSTITIHSLPVVAISGLNPVCAGQTGIQYSATSGFSSYAWQISGSGIITGGNNTSSINVNAGPTYNTSFTLTLNATNSFGCIGVNTVQMFIQDTTKPLLTIPASPQNRNVNPNTCEYTAIGSEFNPLSYSDNCQLQSISNNLNGGNTLAGYVFQLGITNVIWTATDAAGNIAVKSFNVVVRDNQPPIISCPSSQVVCANSPNGYLVSSNQWDAAATDNCSLSGIDYTLSGATTGTGSTLNNVLLAPGITTIKWRAVDAAGNVTSCSNISVTVLSVPLITSQPQSVTVCPMTTQAVFSVSANPSPSYQWRKNGVNINGATFSTFSINNPQPFHAGIYDVVVTNTCGSVTSNPAQLIIPGPLSASIDTTSIIASAGYDPDPIILSTAKSGGAPPYTYQWQLNGVNIPMATGTTYDPGQLMQVGVYRYHCIVCDACGTLFSTEQKKITILEPLPIDLISFDGICNTNTVQLTWQTATETNNDYFIIESSLDARNWDVIAQIDGAGNSNQLLAYEFTDNNPLGNLSYYRLTQTDFDGKFEVFDPISVKCSDDASDYIKIFPNPFSDALSFEFLNQKNLKTRIVLYDILGNLVYEQEITANQGEIHSASLHHLPAGIYTVYIISGSITSHQKLVKE